MELVDDLDGAVLHALRIKGRAAVAGMAAGLAAPEEAVSAALARAESEGLATHRSGRLAGWLLTPDGRGRWDDLNAADRARVDLTKLTSLYDSEFLPLNNEFKALCADWQLAAAPATAESLSRIHQVTADLLGRISSLAPRFGGYQRRLDAAHGQFQAGITTALLQPFTDSYHDVWLELHEDLLLLLDKTREETD